MSLLKKSWRIFREKGPKELMKSSYLFVLERDAVDYIITTVFDDVLYEKMIMWPHIGYWPQIRNPRSFNEKLAHRKLLTDKEKFTEVQDKWAVREYMREKVGEEILTEVYHVTDDPDTISFDELPDKFVVKPTHGCGWIEIVDDKNEADFKEVRDKCEEWLSKTFGQKQREYWYNGIKPRIMVEEFIEGKDSRIPRDYKFFVFHGEVKLIQVNIDRFSNHRKTIFNTDWEVLDFEFNYPKGEAIDRPDNLSEMIQIAEKLGQEFDFIRVDLYNPSEGDIIFGELTVAPGSGRGWFKPTKYDFKIGEHW